METLNRIKKLLKNSDSIKELINVNFPQWTKRPNHFDKIGYGFNSNSQFKACEPVSIFFDSHMGTYGDSGCSRQCSLDSDIFSKHFIKYLNTHKDEIMLEIAKYIEIEALSLKNDAEKELNKNLKELQALENSFKNEQV